MGLTLMPKIKSQETLVRERKRWAALAILVAAIVGSYLWWKQGTLRYEEWSPNQQYVVRNYKTFEFIPRFTMPGDGGHYSGYMRVYDKNGKQLYEEFRPARLCRRPLLGKRRRLLDG